MKELELKVAHPGPISKKYLDKTRRFESPGDCSFSLSDETVVEERGEGAVITDPDGNEFLDFMAGFGACNTGHCHPKVVAAIREQAGKLLHIMGAVNPVHSELAELITEVTPGSFRKRVQLGNSGAEAVEVALKVAKYWKRRSEIICFHGAFHGRSYGALSLMAKKSNREGLYPMLPGVVSAPYAYCYRCSFGLEYPGCGLQCAKYVEYLVKGAATFVTEPAAIILEPIQGNGGIVVPPDEFMPELRRICTENEVLLIDDEVMSGWCRTGKTFAVDHWGVEPDILVVAKGIASGLPLSAAVARAEVFEGWPIAKDGSTFSGNPVSCAAALATIGVYREERLAERAEEMGAYFMEGLRILAKEHEIIGEVRGKGLMVGVELVKDRETKEPLVVGRKATDSALRKGLLIYAGGYDGNVLGFLPPLVIQKEHVDRALGILDEVLGELDKGGR